MVQACLDIQLSIFSNNKIPSSTPSKTCTIIIKIITIIKAEKVAKMKMEVGKVVI